MTRSTLNQGKAVTLYSAAADAAIIAPTGATSGAAITGLGANPPRTFALCIDASTTATFSDGKLYGYDPIDTAWRLIAQLNQGLAISLTAAIGYMERMVDIATFSRLAVSGTLSAGTATIQIKAIEEL